MKHLLIYLSAMFALTAPIFASRGHNNHKKDPNGKHRREGYLRNNGKPCPHPDVPCAWRGRCVGRWEQRPCGICPAPGCTPVTVNNTVWMVPTVASDVKCVKTAFTTIVPTVACTTFVIPGADNKNCRGERNSMVEDLINKYAKSDAIVFLNGQEIAVKGNIVVSGSTVIKTGVVTVTGADANAAPAEQSMTGTLAAILLMAGAALFI